VPSGGGDEDAAVGSAAVSLPPPSPAAVAALAPTGALRAGINLSNFLLVTGRDVDGSPRVT
jgi:hypothetical protein